MPKSNPVTPNKQPSEDWNELLTEFRGKGGRALQKTFIRKLWAVQEDIIANANPSTLRCIFFAPALLICPEGIKLSAEILPKIGVGNGLILLEKLILKFNLTDTECQRYGEVFVTAWRNAYQEANFDLTEELETDVISVMCQHALYAHRPTCTKFQNVIAAFAHAKKLDKSVDEMVTRLLNGCLYRALDAPNYIVQSSAAEVFFNFYPLIGEDTEDMDRIMENQHRYMMDLLRSDVISIRSEATKHVLKAISEFWLLIPKNIVKELMGYIIDTVAKDTVVSVRVAVFEGLNEMAFVPACLTAFEYGLKCAVDPALQDKSERVRLAAYQIISRLKNHKFISVFDIITRDDAIAKLDLENVETCRRQLIPIMHICLPISKSLDEAYYRPRVNYMLGKSRLALLSYFRLLGPMKIIDASQASKLIEMFITWAYRYLRKKDGPPLPETAEGYKKARAYLECALILYMSCKGMLMSDGDGTSKAKCDQIFGKVVKEIFEKYANTPILGTATAISSVIPKDYLKSIANDVLARLEDDDVPPEAVEPFLESAIHFNPDSVFDSFDSGLNVLVNLYGTKQSKKKRRELEDPEDVLIMTLNRLKYLLQSHSTSNLIAMKDEYRTKVLDLLKKIDLIREGIEIRLAKEEGQEHTLSDDVLLSILEFRFILPFFAATNGSEDAADRNQTIESMKNLLLWFEKNISSQMATFGEHNQDFLIQLTSTFLNCVNVSLSAYDFKTRPVEFEDEEDNENRDPREENDAAKDQATVAEVISRIVKSFCNSSTPFEIFRPALRVGTTLCDESYSEVHHEMALLLRFIPKWMNKQCDLMEDDEENIFKNHREIVESLRQFHKRVSETDYWDEDSAKRMMHHFMLFSIVSASSKNDDEAYDDPRDEDYKPPHFISLALIKFILKEKSLTEDIIEEISTNYIPEDSKYFTAEEGELKTDEKLSKLAALSQLLRILERYSKFHGKLIKEAIDKCTTRVLDCFANASDLNTVAHHILNSLSSLLDVQLPDENRL